MKKTIALILSLVLMLSLCSSATLAEERVTIRFSWWGDALRHEATLEAIRLFEEKYPNIHVEAEYGGWDGYSQKLQTQISGGTAADVVQDGGHFRQLLLNGAKYIDLNDYLDILDTSKISASLIESYCSMNGCFYGMPTGVQAWTTLQNTTLLQANGIEAPARWTWDGLVEAAQKLHQSDPEAYMLNCSMETLVNWMLPMYIQQKEGGPVISDEYELMFTEETLSGYFTWIERMYQAGGLQSRSESLLYDGSPLENPKWPGGKLAISQCSSASYTWYVYDEYLTENIDVVECFSFAEGEADNDSIVVPPASFYTVPASSEHVTEAIMLINFLVNDLEAGKAQGTVRSLPSNSDVLKVLQENDLVNLGIARAIELGSPRACEMRGTPTGNTEVQNLFGMYIEQIAYGQISGVDAANECYEELALLLEEIKG